LRKARTFPPRKLSLREELRQPGLINLSHRPRGLLEIEGVTFASGFQTRIQPWCWMGPFS